MINTGSPVKDFVKSFFQELGEGLNEGGYASCPENESYAKMELNAIATNELSGEGKAKIFSIGASVEGTTTNSNSHKLTVFVKKYNELEKEKEKTAIEKAKVQQKYATQIALKGA